MLAQTSIHGKKARDAEKTREIILNAAEKVFAVYGFDGARTEMIATGAGYNTSLIFRYFGDKLGLYTEVLKRTDAQVNELLAKVYSPLLENENGVLDAIQFKNFLTNMVQTLFDYLAEHQNVVRILTWEMASGWKRLGHITSQFPTQDTEKFEVIFRKAQDAGILRSNFTPLVQHAMIVQICQAYLASLPLYQGLLPEGSLMSAEATACARQYLVGFVVNGMLTSPQ